jgi:hypothetical protein
MRERTISCLTIALGLLISTPNALAAAGERRVSGLAYPPVISHQVGNDDAGVFYTELAMGTYSQSPGAQNGPQVIELSGTSYRSLTGLLGGETVDIVSMSSESRAEREGSHMTGIARGNLTLRGNVIWRQSQDYDVTTWAGSEAVANKTENVYNYESPEKTFGVSLGVINVNVKARYSGSVALYASARSDFFSQQGRHGVATGSTGGNLTIGTVATVDANVFGVLGLAVTAENKFTISYPGVGMGRWDYTTDEPVERRNSYLAAGTFPLTGSAKGRFFVQGNVFGNFEIGNIATWNEPRLFEKLVKTKTMTDVGAYE